MDDDGTPPPPTKKSRTDDADGNDGGGGSETTKKFNLAELVMAHAGGDISRLSSEQLELLCPGMPANVARVLIPILASKGRKERDQEQRDRIPPGAPGYDTDMVAAPYCKEGYDRSPFGADLSHPPQVVLQKILQMLTIGDVFACYRTSRAWVNDAVTIMAEKSKATEDRFACKCVGLRPKIMGKYVDLSADTHAWCDDPMDVTLIPHLPNLRYFYDPKIDLSNLSEGGMKTRKESYIVRLLAALSSKYAIWATRSSMLASKLRMPQRYSRDAPTFESSPRKTDSRSMALNIPISSWRSRPALTKYACPSAFVILFAT